MAHRFQRLILSSLIFAGFAGSAQAHVGVGSTSGFMHGFMHPLSGLDHMLAMTAVGLFAARIGGKALWAVPAAFVAMMAVGGAMGISGMSLPGVELGIAASVIVLGAAVALDFRLPIAAAMGLVGFFALFHGHAHGSEMPTTVSGLTYGIGFTSATALLHAFGIGLGLGIGKMATSSGSTLVLRVAGGAVAAAGVGLMAGYI